jgi:hypothetical protein
MHQIHVRHVIQHAQVVPPEQSIAILAKAAIIGPAMHLNSVSVHVRPTSILKQSPARSAPPVAPPAKNHRPLWSAPAARQRLATSTTTTRLSATDPVPLRPSQVWPPHPTAPIVMPPALSALAITRTVPPASRPITSRARAANYVSPPASPTST